MLVYKSKDTAIFFKTTDTCLCHSMVAVVVGLIKGVVDDILESSFANQASFSHFRFPVDISTLYLGFFILVFRSQLCYTFVSCGISLNAYGIFLVFLEFLKSAEHIHSYKVVIVLMISMSLHFISNFMKTLSEKGTLRIGLCKA